jgi:hypothetical protein
VTAVSAAAAAAAFVAVATTAACATPPTLHLNAVVYDIHESGRVYTDKEKLFQGTTRVGEDSSRCTKLSKSSYRCSGTYTLPHGTLQFSGTVPLGSNHLAITGGTGIYKGVRGTVATDFNKAGTQAKETLSFT